MHHKNIETQSLFSHYCTCTRMNISNYFLCQYIVLTQVHKIRPNIYEFVPLYDHLLLPTFHYEITKIQFSESAVGISIQEICCILRFFVSFFLKTCMKFFFWVEQPCPKNLRYLQFWFVTSIRSVVFFQF